MSHAMCKRFSCALALLVLGGCGTTRVADKSVAALPLESKLDLIEAENDLFIALDAVDETSTRVLETRDEYRQADDRIDEAEEALEKAEQGKDGTLLQVAQLSLQETKERKEFLEAWLDVQWALLDVEKAKLDLARARFERTKAQLVKKANVEGAESIDTADFDEQVRDLEQEVKDREGDVKALSAEAERVRGVWYATRRGLAQKTGGAQGSPWVQ